MSNFSLFKGNRESITRVCRETFKQALLEIVGGQIAGKRKEQDFTQERLAESVQVSTETISRLERGVTVPSLKTLEKISKALNTPLKEFFDVEQLSKPENAPTSELSKLINFLKTRDEKDIELSYRILKDVFKTIEKNYRLKER